MKLALVSILMVTLLIGISARAAESPPVVANPFPGGLDMDCDEGFYDFYNDVNSQIAALRAKYLTAVTDAERTAIFEQLQALELKLLQARMYCTIIKRQPVPTSPVAEETYCTWLDREILGVLVLISAALKRNSCVVLDATGNPKKPFEFTSPASEVCRRHFVTWQTWVAILKQHMASTCGKYLIAPAQPAPVQSAPVSQPQSGLNRPVYSIAPDMFSR